MAESLGPIAQLVLSEPLCFIQNNLSQELLAKIVCTNFYTPCQLQEARSKLMLAFRHQADATVLEQCQIHSVDYPKSTPEREENEYYFDRIVDLFSLASLTSVELPVYVAGDLSNLPPPIDVQVQQCNFPASADERKMGKPENQENFPVFALPHKKKTKISENKENVPVLEKANKKKTKKSGNKENFPILAPAGKTKTKKSANKENFPVPAPANKKKTKETESKENKKSCKKKTESHSTAQATASQESVKSLRKKNVPGNIQPPTIFTKSDLEVLYNKALVFYEEQLKMPKIALQCFYRDKPKAYFSKILKSNGIMKPYLKDKHGHAGNPLNGKLNGLFFNIRKPVKGKPPQGLYGDRRLSVPAKYFLSKNKRLYFADFYCIHSTHYVTLVLSTKGSAANSFCHQNLLRLDFAKNEFLCRSLEDNKYNMAPEIWIEMFITVDVPLKVGTFANVNTIGPGRSTGGIRSNPKCTVCNMLR